MVLIYSLKIQYLCLIIMYFQLYVFLVNGVCAGCVQCVVLNYVLHLQAEGHIVGGNCCLRRHCLNKDCQFSYLSHLRPDSKWRGFRFLHTCFPVSQVRRAQRQSINTWTKEAADNLIVTWLICLPISLFFFYLLCIWIHVLVPLGAWYRKHQWLFHLVFSMHLFLCVTCLSVKE